MNKKDWQGRLKEFKDMLATAKGNKIHADNQIEELESIILMCKGKIETFK